MSDDYEYPLLMQADTLRCNVIVNMTGDGIGTVVGTGNRPEQYEVGHYSNTWRMSVFAPLKDSIAK